MDTELQVTESDSTKTLLLSEEDYARRVFNSFIMPSYGESSTVRAQALMRAAGMIVGRAHSHEYPVPVAMKSLQLVNGLMPLMGTNHYRIAAALERHVSEQLVWMGHGTL